MQWQILLIVAMLEANIYNIREHLPRIQLQKSVENMLPLQLKLRN